MRNLLVLLAFMAVAPVMTIGQTDTAQATRSGNEQELIRLSQEFVKTSFEVDVDDVDNSRGVIRPDPDGRLSMTGAEIKHRWKAIGLKDLRVRIDGDKAEVSGRVIFGGEGAPREISSGVNIRYRKQEGRWQYIDACLGACDPQ